MLFNALCYERVCYSSCFRGTINTPQIYEVVVVGSISNRIAFVAVVAVDAPSWLDG